MPVTSADPTDLRGYVDAADDATARVRTAAGDLRDALDAFRSSAGRSAFLGDVPEADLDLTFLALRWSRLAGWVDGVAGAFAAADSGAGGTLTLDDGDLGARWAPPEVEVVRRDGRAVVDTGTGDDDVWVLGDTGEGVVLLVNGRTYVIAGSSGDLLLRTGSGDDGVNAHPWARVPTEAGFSVDAGSGDDVVVIVSVAGAGGFARGGAGDDTIEGGDGDDRIVGGDGADTVHGHGGDDRILGQGGDDVIDGGDGDDRASGGEGDDLVYGEDGDDDLTGGDGRDHVDGGGGDDQVAGGSGDDVLSGGEGDDVVIGGDGHDVAYAGPGVDLVSGGPGADSVHVEPDDWVEPLGVGDAVYRDEVDLSLLDDITIDVADPELRDRIRSDLVTLASTRAGAALLRGLVGHAISIVVRHPDDDADALFDVDSYDPGRSILLYRLGDDEAGFGPDPGADLSYSPLVALHHELVHAYDHAHGTRADGVYLGDDADDIPVELLPDADPDPYVVDRPAPGRGVRLDGDGDGTVTRQELFAALDEDGDAVLSDDELDLNGDGSVDAADGFTNNRERAAVGLPIDHDRDPATPDVVAYGPHDPRSQLNENALRNELGVPNRDGY